MTFGPNMNLVASNALGQRTEVAMRPIDQSDLADLPDINSVPEAQLFTSPHFVAKVGSLKEKDGGAYYQLMRDGNEGWYWGVYVEDRLAGVAGYNDLIDKQGPESFTMLLDHFGKGVGKAVALARTYHAFEIAGLGRIRAEVNVENAASYKVVSSLGYACLSHTQKYNQERHNLTVFHPDIVPVEKAAPTPFHGQKWIDAQTLTTRALVQARANIRMDNSDYATNDGEPLSSINTFAV